MSDWKGPWKCEKCGDTFTPEFGRERIRDGLCHYGPGVSGVCFGKLVPYERRAVDERVRELVDMLDEARAQIEYLHQKFQPTGSGEAVLARLRDILRKHEKKPA